MAPTSTALQKLPSTKDGSLQVRPIRLVPTNPSAEEDGVFMIPNAATVTISAVGQTHKLGLRGQSQTIGAPLSHLYHTSLGVQVECLDPNNNDGGKTVYRGVYAMDELPIHQTAVISIPLKVHHQTLVAGTGNHNTSNSPICNLSLQLECNLQGPPRSEVVKAHQALGAWFTLIDKVEDVVKEVWNKVEPQIPNAAKKKQALLLLIPAIAGIMVPLTTACVVLSPLVIGFCILFFPIMIPLVVGIVLFVLATVLGTALIMTVLYGSTRHGRAQISSWWNQQSTLQHYWDIVKGPRFGVQTFYYATGPRPTPVTIVRASLPKEKWRRLGVSLSIDGVGSFSYLLPFVGEAFDVVWAPTQTVLIMALYQHVSPNMSYVSFAEEMLPFLDVLPSATTGWMMEFGPELYGEAKSLMENPKESLQALQLVLWGNANQNRHPGGTTRSAVPPSSSRARPSRIPVHAAGRPSRHT